MAKAKGPKAQGFVDKMLHGDHSKDAGDDLPVNDSGAGWKDEPVENDLPIESPKKVSAGRGASSDRKHQLRKFDKFKKGN